MASLNRVTLIGNLGRDPELRYTATGQAVANFTLATNESFKNRSGEWEKRTEWHRIVVWARLAEFCGEHLSKGKQVYVEGRIQTRDWEDREGQKRTTTEINAQRVQLLGPRPDGSFQADGGDPGPTDSSAPESDPGASSGDDIPF